MLPTRGVKNMPNAMETFIATQNIAHFKALLRKETHPDKRQILLQLLANEREKLADRLKPDETIRTNSLSIT
jgi:hypothetical protein